MNKPFMKKLLFLLSIVILFSCNKAVDESPTRQCWSCVTSKSNWFYGTSLVDSVTTCDVLVAVKLDGKEWLKDIEQYQFKFSIKCREINQ
jgi:hypothetical protein